MLHPIVKIDIFILFTFDCVCVDEWSWWSWSLSINQYGGMESKGWDDNTLPLIVIVMIQLCDCNVYCDSTQYSYTIHYQKCNQWEGVWLLLKAIFLFLFLFHFLASILLYEWSLGTPRSLIHTLTVIGKQNRSTDLINTKNIINLIK